MHFARVLIPIDGIDGKRVIDNTCQGRRQAGIALANGNVLIAEHDLHAVSALRQGAEAIPSASE